MTRKRLLALIGALGSLLFAAAVASAQTAQSNRTVSYPSGFAVSPPLSRMPVAPALSQISQPASTGQTIIPMRPRPMVGPPRNALAPSLQDQAVQTAAGAPLELEDEEHKPRFPGVGANGYAPPDPNLAVGPNHIVQMVNTEVGVYNKNGVIFSGFPKTIGSFFSALGGGCTGEFGDPIVQYDKAADRWLISQLGGFSAPYSECIAVSQTNDPTGAYYLYSYSFGSNLNDYPKIAVWPTATNSAYLATYNLFANGGPFVGAALCAYDRAAMLSGAASPASVCYTIANDGGYLPSDLDGSTLPPAGSPGYFLTFETLSSLRYYQLAANFSNPGSSTLSAPTDITVASFSEACGGGTCIPQPGTSQQLDSLGDRPMYRMAYRNFGDHDALVVNHSVTAGSSVGVRWYELRGPLNGAFALYQQGTFAPDSTYRWMASAAMDAVGDIAIGYSASSSSVFPSIRYTGRTPSDALGTMRAETSMLAGSGSQTGGLSRWGDYTAMRIDPSDDCTFWYTNQYQPSNGSFNWATFIGSFKFSNCGTTPDFSVSASPPSQTVVQGGSTSYTATVAASGGFNGTVSLSASGLPTGATATFNPTSISGGAGSSTLSVTTSAGTPTGSYTLTITGTSASLTHSTPVTLVVNAASSPNFSISVSPSSQTVVQGSSTSYSATVTASGGFTGTVSLSASGLPTGASAAFSPTSISGGAGSSTLSVTTSASTPAGSYTLTVTGTSTNPSLTHSTTVTLVVTSSGGTPGFSISASPSSQTVARGNSTTYTVTATALNGFSGTVTFRVRGLPSSSSASFNPASVTGQGTSTLTVNTNSSTSTGTFSLRIRGTSGGVTHSTTVQLVVQ
jgi:hypothetical protein